MTAIRVQLSRKKGWRMPPNSAKVDRSTRWGNPCAMGLPYHKEGARTKYVTSRQQAVDLFRAITRRGEWSARVTGQGTFTVTTDDVRRELRGKNLACWCPLVDANGNAVPCHADVLLELANAPADE